MLTITLSNDNKLGPRNGYRVLCLGSHSDDIEIGCGGTVLRLLEDNPNCEIYWVVFSATAERRREALKGAQLFLKGAKTKRVLVQEHRDSFFPFVGDRIKEDFERLKKEFVPELILTHYRHDLHQDHRLISDLTWNTFRNHFILEYEIPKYDGDMGCPNFFVPLDESILRRKMAYVFKTFRTQSQKPWFTEDTFRAVLRLRGVESNAPGKYAEAFYCRKLVGRLW
jgi:LmbE family N-acetylglucosaminyl deacetylase